MTGQLEEVVSMIGMRKRRTKTKLGNEENEEKERVEIGSSLGRTSRIRGKPRRCC